MSGKLAADHLHQVVFSQGQLVPLHDHAFTFGIVHLQGLQVADERVGRVAVRGVVGRQCAGVNAGQSGERIDREVRGGVRGVELLLAQAVHDHADVAGFLAQVGGSVGDGHDTGSLADLRDADRAGGVAGAGRGHIGDQFGNQLVQHAVDDLVVDVADEGFTAQGDRFIGDLDPLLDVLGLQLDDAQLQVFLGQAGRAFGVDVRAVRALLEGNLHVALEEGLVHPAQQAVLFPGGLDHVVNIRGHRDIAGRGGRVDAQQGAALLVVALQDVLLVRFAVFSGATDFQFSHGFLLLVFFFGLADLALGDLPPGLFLLGGLVCQLLELVLQLFGFLRQLPGFLVQRVQIGFRVFQVSIDLSLALFDLALTCNDFLTRHGSVLLSGFSGFLRSCARVLPRPESPSRPRRSIRRRWIWRLFQSRRSLAATRQKRQTALPSS